MDSSAPGTPDPGGGRSRDEHGRMATGPAELEKAGRALELRKRGLTYAQIAAEMGYADGAGAHKAVQAALRGLVTEMTLDADELRRLELERLDQAEAAVWRVLEREHVTVSQGRVVRQWVLDEDGHPIVLTDDQGNTVYDADDRPVYQEEPVLDDDPVLRAVDRLIKIQGRRAALLGLDAPQKIEQAGSVTYQITGVDPDKIV